ncbi:MAG: TA system VapC family ribonuclease toxin [Verrucomicrobiota bacterium]
MALWLPDANVLIHALRKDAAEHVACRQWLVNTAAAGDSLGLCELVEAALLRIPTLPKLRLAPMAETLGYWKDDLWSYAGTRRLAGGTRHTGILAGFITSLKLCGNDVNDAWLAALAIEHRATLVSTDQGFARFAGLKWCNPVNDT